MTNSSRAGLALIKTYEGCKLTAYLCPAGKWTIGYGRTTNVKKGDTCSQAQADAWLLEEYDAFESKVRALVKVALTANQLGALVSFAYNVGVGALKDSTLLRLLNAADYSGAAAQFARWNKGGGKVLPGLVKRRAAEAALFSK
ncbi:lysozyme [Sphingomonas paucimobilis]|uniref:lysozyme n=1 Tax=Sphingomonas paucimobilis TaxID=13689 RepID=UPI0031CF9FC5